MATAGIRGQPALAQPLPGVGWGSTTLPLPPAHPPTLGEQKESSPHCPEKQEEVPAVRCLVSHVDWLIEHPGWPGTVLRTPSGQSDKHICPWGHTAACGPLDLPGFSLLFCLAVPPPVGVPEA